MSESLWLRLGDWSALRDRDRLGGEASQSELSWRRRLGGDRSSSSDVSWRRRGEGDREPPGELSCRLLLGDRSWSKFCGSSFSSNGSFFISTRPGSVLAVDDQPDVLNLSLMIISSGRSSRIPATWGSSSRRANFWSISSSPLSSLASRLDRFLPFAFLPAKTSGLDDPTNGTSLSMIRNLAREKKPQHFIIVGPSYPCFQVESFLIEETKNAHPPATTVFDFFLLFFFLFLSFWSVSSEDMYRFR